MNNDRSIVVNKLSRAFGTFQALKDVSLSVESGSIFGFLGPNGAGKSTLIKILTTILAPTAGTATVAGLDIATHASDIRQRIGVALQDVGVDPVMRARELLELQARLFRMSPQASRIRSEELMKTVGLADVDPKRKVGDYSGGMKRRLDLALALVHRPDILFLDEPTTGLDPVSRVQIWEEVRRLNREQGMTIFLTTQYLEEADKLADRIAIINEGTIVADGTPASLKAKLGKEVITLAFDTPTTASKATQLLTGHVDAIQQSGHEVLCYLTNGAQRLPELLRELDAAKLVLQTVSIAQPSLDDVFLQATGARLQVSDTTQPSP